MGIRSWMLRKISPNRLPSKVNAEVERAWLAEQMAAYTSTTSIRVGGAGENWTQETPEIRRSYPEFLKEPTLKMAFWAKVDAVSAQEVNVIPRDENAEADKRIASFVADAITWSRGGTAKISRSILVPALLRGWSLTEKVWATAKYGDWRGLWVLDTVKSKDTDGVHVEIDKFKNVTAFIGSANNQNAKFDPRSFVYWVYQQLFESPVGISDFRAVNRAVTLKEAAIKLRMIFLDKFTGPFLIGKYSSDDQRKYLEAALKKARASGYIVMDRSNDTEVLNLAVSGTSDFKTAIDDFDKEILVGIRGSHLDMREGDNPTARGNSKVQRSISELAEWSLADAVENCLNEQVIPDLVYPNFGINANLPRAKLGSINALDVLAELRVDEMLTNRLRVPVSRADVYRRAGRSGPKDDGDAVEPLAVPDASPLSDPARFAEEVGPKA